MAKELKDWIDEFVKNGANPKNVPHWPEEAGGSGTKVVSELPQVGEEYTIYELQEISKASYGWMFTSPFVDNSEKINLVFDTYEQMTKTMNEIKVIEGTTYPPFFVAYIRNTNQMYMLNPVFTDQPHWEFTEVQKQKDESGTDYAFKVEYTENRGSLVITVKWTYYILKEFVGNERPVVDGGLEYSGITLDDKEVYISSGKRFGILSNITYPRWVMLPTSFIGCPGTFTYDKLPDSVELETKFYNLLRFAGTYGFNNNQFVMYNTTNKAYYILNPKTTAYQWYNNTNDRENCYFAQSGNYEGEPPHYTGELEWAYAESIDDFPEDHPLKHNEIPYNDMINHNPPFDESPACAFQPKKGGEINSTYWIYTNDEWVNVEDIGEPKIPIIYFYWYDGERFTGLDINSITLQVNNKKVDLIEVDNGHEDSRRQFIGYVDKSSTYSVSFENHESLPATLYHCSNFGRVNTSNVNFDETRKIANFTTTFEPIVIIFESRPQL